MVKNCITFVVANDLTVDGVCIELRRIEGEIEVQIKKHTDVSNKQQVTNTVTEKETLSNMSSYELIQYFAAKYNGTRMPTNNTCYAANISGRRRKCSIHDYRTCGIPHSNIINHDNWVYFETFGNAMDFCTKIQFHSQIGIDYVYKCVHCI